MRGERTHIRERKAEQDAITTSLFQLLRSLRDRAGGAGRADHVVAAADTAEELYHKYWGLARPEDAPSDRGSLGGNIHALAKDAFKGTFPSFGL